LSAMPGQQHAAHVAVPVESDPALAAKAAARRAGVRVRELTDLADLRAAYELYAGIWRPDPLNPPVTTDLLRAFVKAENYVAGAFDGNDLVGACVAFFSAPADGALHSHIAGVSASARGRNVGFALKLHQRAWALAHGLSTIMWTFDPLVARNAHFNLNKLAARCTEYLPNFYGSMYDGINGTDESDRVFVRWQLGAPEVVAACMGRTNPMEAAAARASGADLALGISEFGHPVRGRIDSETCLVAVPTDIEALRDRDPAEATRWRHALRDVLGTLLTGGSTVVGFDRAGWYLTTRPCAAEDQP